MAQQKQLSLKRVGLDKAKARIVAITAGAAFLVVFFLIASYTLYNQLTYQNRVIAVKKDAVQQLRDNLEARDDLVESYKAFVARPNNVLSGTASGNGPSDGNNAKLVLDALPSKYDFPALAASIEKLVTTNRAAINDVTGTDDEIAQAQVAGDGEPVALEIPIEVTMEGGYADLQKVVSDMERSIRPFQFTELQLSGDQSALSLKVAANTFYQPEKTLNIKREIIE